MLIIALGYPTSRAAIFTVTTTSDGSAGSLRQAIVSANASPGPDTIAFNILPNDGMVKTILITNNLPTITSAVVIDGYTQPGASANTLAAADNATLLIEITSTNNRLGLMISGGGSTVRGLVLNRLSTAITLQVGGSNVIEGNFIGTDPTGRTDRGNGGNGIGASTGGTNTIGGPTPAARNIISGNANNGIRLSTDGNLVQGNFIGPDATGTNAFPNAVGILIDGDRNLIGGTVVGAGNIISGNTGDGIQMNNASANAIRGNLIGTDPTGTRAMGNAANGINSLGALNGTNVIGGTNAAARNIISANNQSGVNIGNPGNFIQGNFIGTDITGANALPNGTGINLSGGRDNLIGPANLIAFNRSDGVASSGVSEINNRITANSIFANGSAAGHLGIDLGLNGVTPNDAGDTDTGANRLQNFPLLTNVVVSLTGVTFRGFLSSAAKTAYTLEFFANDLCTPNGPCEGQAFIGSTNVTTDATGTHFFTVTLAAANATCRRFQASATATDPAGNTSEFSACRLSSSLDTDGDGACDVEEVLAGTDPFNPASVFRITDIKLEAADIRVTWKGGGDRTNILQTTTSLSSSICSDNFVDLPPEIALPGTGDVFTNRLHLGGATNSARFYRVRLVR